MVIFKDLEPLEDDKSNGSADTSIGKKKGIQEWTNDGQRSTSIFALGGTYVEIFCDTSQKEMVKRIILYLIRQLTTTKRFKDNERYGIKFLTRVCDLFLDYPDILMDPYLIKNFKTMVNECLDMELIPYSKEVAIFITKSGGIKSIIQKGGYEVLAKRKIECFTSEEGVIYGNESEQEKYKMNESKEIEVVEYLPHLRDNSSKNVLFAYCTIKYKFLGQDMSLCG